MGKKWGLKWCAGPRGLGSSAAAWSHAAEQKKACFRVCWAFQLELLLCTCQSVGRGSPPFMISILPACSSSLEVFILSDEPSIKWVACVHMLRAGTLGKQTGVGNLWSSPFLFPVTQLQAILTKQMYSFQFTVTVKLRSYSNQSKYFYTWL